MSDPFKSICVFIDSLCLNQLINLPTWLNHKDLVKFTLLDVILTNAPHRFSAVGVFCDDVSDHCPIVCVRDCRTPKSKLCFILKRQFKN